MPSIDEVARHAGVSLSTVSYVLSGKRPISEATAARVRASIAELGYRPNASARALASRKAGAIALMAPFRGDNNVPVIMQFVAAVAEACRERDHDVLLVTELEGVEGVRRVSDSSLVDGVVLMDVEVDDPRAALLTAAAMPAVQIGHGSAQDPVPYIDLDMAAASRLAVDALADAGHRTIALLAAPAEVYRRRSTYALRVVEGFTEQASIRGLNGTWRQVEQSYESAAAAIDDQLREHPGTTALFVHNEAILSFVLEILAQRGLRVPEDISLVAIAPDDVARNLRIPVSNITIPAAEIGRDAVRILFDVIEGRDVASHLVDPELTVRASFRPATGSA